jgi:hypothetical protein
MAAVAATVGKVVGGVLQYEGYNQAAEGARVAASRKKMAATFEAEQLEQQAGQAIAASQRDALEERRKADLAASRALALAAASGGGASDTTVVNLIAGLKGEGAYRSAVAIYRGEDQARKMRMGAQGKRFEGAVAEEGGQFESAAYKTMAMASLFDIGSSLATRYGGSSSGGTTSKGYR